MLSEVVEGGRALRLPLFVGYAAIFDMWLLFYTAIPTESDASSFALAVIELGDQLGSGARVALVSVAAMAIGSLITTVLLEPLLRWVERRPQMPDWERFVQEAFEAAERYQEFSIEQDSKFRARVPAPIKSKRLESEWDDRRRRRADVEFRLGAAIALLPTCILLGWRGGGAWWWCTLLPVIFVAQARIGVSRTLNYMYEQHRKALDDRIQTLERLIERRKRETEPAHQNAREKDKEEELARLRKERKALTPRSFRKSPDSAIRCHKCGQIH